MDGNNKLFSLTKVFIISLWLLHAQTTVQIHAAKVLGLFAHPSESHFSVMSSVMTELARRGHNVTVYTTHGLNENMERLNEILIEPEFPFWKTLMNKAGTKNSVAELSRISPEILQKHLGYVAIEAMENFLKSAPLTRLLQLSTTEFDYDLLIVDVFYTEVLLAFGHAHGKPTIGIVSSNFENYMQHVLEHLVPIACTPLPFEHNSLANTYWSRLTTIRDCISRRKSFIKHHLQPQQQLLAKYFHKHYAVDNLPSMGDLEAHLAVLLLNNHVPLFEPRPLLLHTITAGGLHVRPARELPWHIRRHLDNARNGAIYINLGDAQLCADIPADMLRTFLTVLARRTEAVLWTCHDVNQFPNMPKNLLIQHGATQSDILAHPHIKVFIMNGDLLGLQEGILRHVPMLGLPLFRHEKQNMRIATELGVALTIEEGNFNNVSLANALQSLLEDQQIPLIIREVATQFRDRPLGALETCIYWIDYVLRHNGGSQLKTRGIGLSDSSHLHLYDLFIFYFGGALAIVAIAFAIFIVASILWKRRQSHVMSVWSAIMRDHPSATLVTTRKPTSTTTGGSSIIILTQPTTGASLNPLFDNAHEHQYAMDMDSEYGYDQDKQSSSGGGSSSTSFLTGPLVFRVRPDGSPVEEDRQRPLPVDDDLEQLFPTTSRANSGNRNARPNKHRKIATISALKQQHFAKLENPPSFLSTQIRRRFLNNGNGNSDLNLAAMFADYYYGRRSV